MFKNIIETPSFTTYNKDMYNINISYVHQPIPSPFPMLPFESINDGNNYRVHYICNIADIISYFSPHKPSTLLTIDGKRVQIYADIIDICNMISNCSFQYLTNYYFTEKSFKYWNHLPQQYKSHLCDFLTKIISTEKSHFIQDSKQFQYNQVKLWNPKVIETSKILIPPIDLGWP